MTAMPRSMTGRVLGLLGVLLAAGSLAAGILVRGDGGSQSSGGGGSQSSGAGAAVKADAVTIKDFEFMPATVEVKAGTKVTFTNKDTAPHTATGDTFDTGTIREGQKKTVTLEQPGKMAYICEFHPFMKGTVVVK